MWRLDTRVLCAAALVISLSAGCRADRSMRHAQPGGQGRTSLLGCLLAQRDSTCDEECHPRGVPMSPPAAWPPASTAESPGEPARLRPAPPAVQLDDFFRDAESAPDLAPPPPSEPLTRAGRPDFERLRRSRLGRRVFNRLPASIPLSIPLPKNWFGRSESAAATSEPAQGIPWDAPVAVTQPDGTIRIRETAQVVGYEYGQPVELLAPEFDNPALAEQAMPGPAQARIAAGHSVLAER